ncbi:unnamed protein product, partial [Prorocentrum cordatum]
CAPPRRREAVSAPGGRASRGVVRPEPPPHAGAARAQRHAGRAAQRRAPVQDPVRRRPRKRHHRIPSKLHELERFDTEKL